MRRRRRASCQRVQEHASSSPPETETAQRAAREAQQAQARRRRGRWRRRGRLKAAAAQADTAAAEAAKARTALAGRAAGRAVAAATGFHGCIFCLLLPSGGAAVGLSKGELDRVECRLADEEALTDDVALLDGISVTDAEEPDLLHLACAHHGARGDGAERRPARQELRCRAHTECDRRKICCIRSRPRNSYYRYYYSCINSNTFKLSNPTNPASSHSRNTTPL